MSNRTLFNCYPCSSLGTVSPHTEFLTVLLKSAIFKSDDMLSFISWVLPIHIWSYMDLTFFKITVCQAISLLNIVLFCKELPFFFSFHLFLINDLQYTAADVSPFFYCHFICILRNFFLGSSLSEFTLKISPPHAQNCCVFSGTPSTLCRQNLIIPNAAFPDFSVLQPENLSCLHFFPL